MNDPRPYSLLQIRDLAHGIHDLPGFDTNDFRSFVVRLDPHETRLPIARSGETLLLVVEGSLTVTWSDATRASTELGERDAALTNPSAIKLLVAGAEGATFLALVSRTKKISCVKQLSWCRLRRKLLHATITRGERCPRRS